MVNGMYVDFCLPHGLYSLIQHIIANNQNNPNTPQVTTPPALRMWFSQPRTAIPSLQKITLYTLADTGYSNLSGAQDTRGLAAQIGSAANPTLFDWVPVPYPASFSLLDSVDAGASALMNMIEHNSGQFALVGAGQGAMVISAVLNQLRDGPLAARLVNCVAAVTFGNPHREAGHTFPGCPDPGGHGISEHRLINTPDWWWDFVVPGDILCHTEDDPFGGYLIDVFRVFWASFNFGDNWPVFLRGIGGVPSNIVTTFIDWGPDFMGHQSPHTHYGHHAPLPGNSASCIELAIQYLNRIGAEKQASYNHPLTDVVTVNFKLPLSVSEIGFDALRVSCHVELWYLDRYNNWRQVLDESRAPTALDLSVSQAQAWYTAHFYCYPFVAKALQWRFTRTYDSLVGNQPYCVGMRNGLIRRNIYNRAEGMRGIELQQDPIGNTFTSYIKDWDAFKAIDNAPTTYWKSMPMPDPGAVCNLYLDVRTPNGSPQLVDTLYIDPVYTGQALNLYYTNDETVGGIKLSPVTAVPTNDQNTRWQQGKGRWDVSGEGQVADYQFPFAWGPLHRQPTWIGIEWTPDFNSGYSNEAQLVTVTGAPTGGDFTLSFGGVTTDPIVFNASPYAVQMALAALPTVGAGNVGVAGLAGGPYTVTFKSALGGAGCGHHDGQCRWTDRPRHLWCHRHHHHRGGCEHRAPRQSGAVSGHPEHPDHRAVLPEDLL